ncbi:WD40 repeat domain-containing protein [Micromonospora sp. CPCC 206061]|uniref:WD40 repeat domain-containing protein n=1 Tax=Micromonospora sp. CPCC 206061 TaxID=3122410 RepID=UPI002FEE7C03
MSETSGVAGGLADPEPRGVSPYATGGGGVTLERRVAVMYLMRLLTGATAVELRGRRVERLAFQQAPAHRVDDLVIRAARDDGSTPLTLSVAVRRAPAFTTSDRDTEKLLGDLIADVPESLPDGAERRLAICVAGPQVAAQEVGKLAALARNQAGADGFFMQIRTRGKFSRAVQGRLAHLVNLVTASLSAVGADTSPGGAEAATWQLLRHLDILMPRVEVPDETDWSELLNQLRPWAREQTLAAAAALRDRLEALAASYAPAAADVDLAMVRRDAHELLDPDGSRVTWHRGERLNSREDQFGRADRAAGWAQQLRDRDPELAVAVAVAAVRELAPSPCAVLTLWGLTTAAQLRRLPIGHAAGPTSLAYLPDLDQLRTIDGSGTVCTWKSSGALASVTYLPGQDVGGCALLSPDGQYAIIAETRDQVALWRIPDEVFLGRRPRTPMNGLAPFSWAANGTVAGQFDYRTVDIYRLGSDGPNHVATLDVGFVSRTAWSPDGRHLAVAADDGVILFAVDTTIETVLKLPVASKSATLAWSPDGRRLAVLTPARGTSAISVHLTGKRSLRVYDVTAGGAVVTAWKLAAADMLVWSPNAAMIAYLAKGDDKDDRLVLRDVDTGEVVRRRRQPLDAQAVWWPKDDQVVTATSIHGPRVWDLAKDKSRQFSAGRIGNVSWAPNHDRAAISTVDAGPRVVGFDPTHTVRLRGGDARTVQWSPAGNIVAGADGPVIALWNPSTGKRLGVLTDGQLPIGALAWSPDGSQLAAASHDFFGVQPGLITVWDVTTRRSLRTIDGAGPLAWAPDDHSLAGTTDGTAVTIWNPRTGQVIDEWRTDQDRVKSLHWSPDSTRLAVPIDHRMEIRHQDSGTILRCVGHTDPIDNTCWSPDSRYVATAAGSGLTIWDPEQGKPMAVLSLPRSPFLVGLHWAAELSATLHDGSVLTWQLPADLWSASSEDEAPGRQLSNDERQRYGLPRQRPSPTTP